MSAVSAEVEFGEIDPLLNEVLLTPGTSGSFLLCASLHRECIAIGEGCDKSIRKPVVFQIALSLARQMVPCIEQRLVVYTGLRHSCTPGYHNNLPPVGM